MEVYVVIQPGWDEGEDRSVIAVFEDAVEADAYAAGHFRGCSFALPVPFVGKGQHLPPNLQIQLRRV